MQPGLQRLEREARVRLVPRESFFLSRPEDSALRHEAHACVMTNVQPQDHFRCALAHAHAGKSLSLFCAPASCPYSSPRASNSSCDPCSTIRPLSITTITSADRTVLSRCAMITCVHS